MAKSKKPATRVTQKAKAEGRALVAKPRRKRRTSEEVAAAKKKAARINRVRPLPGLSARVKAIEADPPSEAAAKFAARYRAWEKAGLV